MEGGQNLGLTGVSWSGGKGDTRSLRTPEVGRGDHLGGRREAKIEQGPPRTYATSHLSSAHTFLFLKSRNRLCHRHSRAMSGSGTRTHTHAPFSPGTEPKIQQKAS